MTRLSVDFGTSNTVAVLGLPDGRVRPLLFDGSPTLPSSVFLDAAGGLLVGRDAVHSARTAPDRFEPNPKRRVDEHVVLLGAAEVPVVELITAVLSRVAGEARRVAGGPVSAVTLTHPAAWAQTRRQVLIDAANRAGIPPTVLVPEPTAAADSFMAVSGDTPIGGCVVVYDLGAGTFDASVVRRTAHGFDVIAAEGLSQAGGLDIDAAITSYLGAHLAGRDGGAFARLMNPTTTEERRANRLLWEDVRNAKELLSRATHTQVHVPLAGVDVPLGRDQFELLARPILDASVNATRAAINSAQVRPADLAGIYLVGGGSRIPLVSTLLTQAFGRTPTATEQPELVVAEGGLRPAGQGARPPAESGPRGGGHGPWSPAGSGPGGGGQDSAGGPGGGGPGAASGPGARGATAPAQHPGAPVSPAQPGAPGSPLHPGAQGSPLHPGAPVSSAQPAAPVSPLQPTGGPTPSFQPSAEHTPPPHQVSGGPAFQPPHQAPAAPVSPYQPPTRYQPPGAGSHTPPGNAGHHQPPGAGGHTPPASGGQYQPPTGQYQPPTNQFQPATGQYQPPGGRPRRNRVLVAAGIAVVLVVGLGAVGLWALLRPDTVDVGRQFYSEDGRTITLESMQIDGDRLRINFVYRNGDDSPWALACRPVASELRSSYLILGRSSVYPDKTRCSSEEPRGHTYQLDPGDTLDSYAEFPTVPEKGTAFALQWYTFPRIAGLKL